MQNSEMSTLHRNYHADKWLTLDVIQRVEQVRCIAEMLDATMEDITDQMENLESVLNCLQEGTEAIQERIEELMDMIEEKVKDEDDVPRFVCENI